MLDTNVIWQHAAHTTDQLSSPSCSTRAIPKRCLLTKNIEELSGEKSQENAPVGRKMTRQKE